MTIGSALITATIAIISAVLAGLVQKEVEGAIKILPFGMLNVARLIVPASQRRDLYDEWAADLYDVLDGDDRPFVRVWYGIRFSLGFIWSGRKIARELQPLRSPGTAADGAPTTSPSEPPTIALPRVNVNVSLIQELIARARKSQESEEFVVGDMRFTFPIRKRGLGYSREEVTSALYRLRVVVRLNRYWLLSVADFEPSLFSLEEGGFLEHDVNMAFSVLRYAFQPRITKYDAPSTQPRPRTVERSAAATRRPSPRPGKRVSPRVPPYLGIDGNLDIDRTAPPTGGVSQRIPRQAARPVDPLTAPLQRPMGSLRAARPVDPLTAPLWRPDD